jgi:2-polyprenyl-3-methyl-5-hydroxy-6-metoxy-1,4-benzoquinol methylase
MMSEDKDYNWPDDGFTNAHAFLLQPVEKLLPPDGSPILDLGCGNGAVANYLLSKNFNVYGTDASESGISIARRKRPDRFYVQDFSSGNLPGEIKDIPFKTVISTEVIEHLYDPRKYISLCKSVLSRVADGKLILSTPYNGYLKYLALSVCGGMDRHLTVLWDGGHIKFWSKKTLAMLLEEQGFYMTKFIGCGRLPYLWKSMVIEAELL